MMTSLFKFKKGDKVRVLIDSPSHKEGEIIKITMVDGDDPVMPYMAGGAWWQEKYLELVERPGEIKSPRSKLALKDVAYVMNVIRDVDGETISSPITVKPPMEDESCEVYLGRLMRKAVNELNVKPEAVSLTLMPIVDYAGTSD